MNCRDYDDVFPSLSRNNNRKNERSGKRNERMEEPTCSAWSGPARRNDSPVPGSSAEPECKFRDLYDIKRVCPPSCKLQRPSTVINNCTLIQVSAPMPEYRQGRVKNDQVPLPDDLFLEVIDHDKCLEELSQQLELNLLHKRNVKPDESEVIQNDFETFRQAKSTGSYVTTVKSGLDARITAVDQSRLRILYIKSISIDNLKRTLGEEFQSFKGLRVVSEAEKASSPPNVSRYFIEEWYEISFGDSKDGEELLRIDPAARLWPPEMDQLQRGDKARLEFLLRWDFHPLAAKAIITLRSNDKWKAMKLLDWNGFNVVESGNVDMFKENSIIPLRMEFLPLRRPLPAREECFRINQRVGRFVWHGARWALPFEAYTDDEWKYCLEVYSVPWTVNITRSRFNLQSDHKATVIFTRPGLAEGVADYIYSRRGLIDYDEKPKQVVISLRYSFDLHVPREIRIVMDSAICDLDRRRQYGDMLEVWWRLRDLPNEILCVEGNNLKAVTDVKEELVFLLGGVRVGCHDNPSSALLYGCGAQWVNKQQNEYEGQIVISVDRLNERITLYGPAKLVEHVRIQLLKFPAHPENFVVSDAIEIDFPRYLPVMQSILNSSGANRISEILGGCEISFDWPKKLIFSGTVFQYNNLKLLLDRTQYNFLIKWIEKVLGINAKDALAFFECSVCLDFHTYHRFSLTCGHSYCLECLTRKIRVELEGKKLPLRCYVKGCQQAISLNTMMSLMFDDKSFKFKEFFSDRLEPLIKLATRFAAEKDGHPLCLKPDCEGILKKVPENYDAQVVRCPLCDTPRCSHCPNPPHRGSSCEEEKKLRSNDAYSLESFVNRSKGAAKLCPGPPNGSCGIPIEKNEGCNHMTCPTCRIHFCWKCLFSAWTIGEIMGHLRDHHGGIGGEWGHLDQPDEQVQLLTFAEGGLPPGIPPLGFYDDTEALNRARRGNRNR